MLAIAVCDDEPITCADMARDIRGILEEMGMCHTISQFYSGEELLRAGQRFDIIFLDIIMRGLDGMEAARVVRQKAVDSVLIFISSSRGYVFEAYDVEAFQYLVKPVERKKLKRVLQKAVQKAGRRPQEFIVVSRERKSRKLFLDDIYYFEIRGRVLEAHGLEGNFEYYGQIGVLEERLQGKGFFRCHKSYLVNLKYVDAYNRREAILGNGERIIISRRRYEAFCEEVLRYMRGHGGIL